MSVKITSDSTCDLGEWVEKRDIAIMHLQVTLDDKVYHDGVDITPQDIFDFVARTRILPKTNAPSIVEYEEFFEEQLKSCDELVHFSISARSSSSCQFAKTAAEKFNGRVRVIDTMALSSGQGLLVLKGADLRDEGKTAAEIEEEINGLRTRVNTSFVPDQLDYLHKGGRVSGMVFFIANALKIHPKIVMNEGQLVQGGKYRGNMLRCLTQYIQDLKREYPSYDKARCFITHSSADADLVEQIKKQVKTEFEFEEIIETVAGSIITSHCGQGTLGVLFIYNKR